MPFGRLVDPTGLREVAKTGPAASAFICAGNSWSTSPTAIAPCSARPTAVAAASRAMPASSSIIPAGAPLPDPGSTLDRDAQRPYEVTEVRQQSDGQLNVFVREIISHKLGLTSQCRMTFAVLDFGGADVIGRGTGERIAEDRLARDKHRQNARRHRQSVRPNLRNLERADRSRTIRRDRKPPFK